MKVFYLIESYGNLFIFVYLKVVYSMLKSVTREKKDSYSVWNGIERICLFKIDLIKKESSVKFDYNKNVLNILYVFLFYTYIYIISYTL